MRSVGVEMLCNQLLKSERYLRSGKGVTRSVLSNGDEVEVWRKMED